MQHQKAYIPTIGKVCDIYDICYFDNTVRTIDPDTKNIIPHQIDDVVMLEYIGVEDKNSNPIYTSQTLKDDRGRIFEVGFCFDLLEKGDRSHFARYEMRCISNAGENDHIKKGEIVSFNDWLYPDNSLCVFGLIHNKEHDLGKETMEDEC